MIVLTNTIGVCNVQSIKRAARTASDSKQNPLLCSMYIWTCFYKFLHTVPSHTFSVLDALLIR